MHAARARGRASSDKRHFARGQLHQKQKHALTHETSGRRQNHRAPTASSARNMSPHAVHSPSEPEAPTPIRSRRAAWTILLFVGLPANLPFR